MYVLGFVLNCRSPSAATQVSAILHSFALELPSPSLLPAFLKSIRSWTSDMGHELGVPDYSCVDPRSMLPAWQQNDELVPDLADVVEEPSADLDVDMDGDGQEVDGEEPAVMPKHQSLLVDVDEPVVMPCGVVFAGFQHVVHNLCKDVVGELHWWEEFFANLKCLEDFLRVKEHRQRLQWTCMQGARHQNQQHKFDKWEASLYEKRWHEVITFLRKLKEVWSLLRQVWSEGFYASVVDRAGMAFKSSGGGDDGGSAKFDPARLTTLLHSSQFEVYMDFVLTLKSIPEDLASWAERCVCHERFYKFVSADETSRRRSKAIATHFGPYLKTGNQQVVCPMAGKRAPEVAAGGLDDFFERLWAMRSGELLQSVSETRGISADVLSSLEDDLQRGRAYLHLGMVTKLDHWKRLPWRLAALGHHDESVARLNGAAALDMFAVDAREAAHHRLTWALLRPGCAFRLQLDNLLDGTPRAALSELYKQNVAAIAFAPIVETTIEGRHAKVALESSGHIGPARVSLANRLALRERQQAENSPPVIPKDAVLNHLDRARHLRSLAGHLGLLDHPYLTSQISSRYLRNSHAYVAPMTSIIYRCDLHSLFQSMQEEQKNHNRMQKRARDQNARLIQQRDDDEGARPRDEFTYDKNVKPGLWLNHFKCVADEDALYSIPAKVVDMEPLTRFLGGADSMSQAKRRRLNPEGSDDGLEVDVDAPDAFRFGDDACSDPMDTDGRILFRVVKFSPSEKKTLAIAPGAGRRLREHDFAIMTYSGTDCADGGALVRTQPDSRKCGGAADPILIVHGFGDTPRVEGSLGAWRRTTEDLQFALCDEMEAQLEQPLPLVREVLGAMGAARAWPSEQEHSPTYIARSEALSW